MDDLLERAWREHRRHVLDVAFRMLGDLGDAEDAVQEGFARLVRAVPDEIDDVGGWLVVVVSRICLDRLRANRRRATTPEASVGDQADHRGGGPADPADRVTLDDGVRVALNLMLERLSAAERTAFVLHDVFQYPFDAIGEIVGRSPAACRQLASRARRAIRDDAGTARFAVEPADQRRVMERFIAACSSGDVEGLLAVLDPDVSGDSDLAAHPFRGSRRIARGALLFLGPESGVTLLSVPSVGGPTLMAVRDGEVVALATLTISGDRITHIEALADPVTLRPLRAALGL